MINSILDEFDRKVRQQRVWRSFFRNGWPEDAWGRSQAIVSNVFLHLHPVKVRRHGVRITYTYGLGGISFLLFLLLTVTGILLMFYYRPAVQLAYGDMKELETTVNLGMLLRNFHRWAAHGMVITVFLHMIRVFSTGSYRPPREFNWVIGVVLLFLTFLLSFTGYLLPWDQLSFWAITVGTNMAGYAPVIGADIRFLLLGAFEVDANALIRFYTLHIILLGLLTAIFMAVHFWRIRKDGGISGPPISGPP